MAAQLKATRMNMKTLRQIVSRKIGLLALFFILAFAWLSHGAEDVAFFEQKYQTKITGVKAIEEYDDPDKFYSATAAPGGYYGRGRVCAMAVSNKGIYVSNIVTVPEKPQEAESEQDGADQPATAPESKREGNDKPKPESGGRSQ